MKNNKTYCNKINVFHFYVDMKRECFTCNVSFAIGKTCTFPTFQSVVIKDLIRSDSRQSSTFFFCFSTLTLQLSASATACKQKKQCHQLLLINRRDCIRGMAGSAKAYFFLLGLIFPLKCNKTV